MLVSSREVDGWEEIITVETDGVITSRTVNGVEQSVSQQLPPSFSRSTESRTARSRTTADHSSDRLRNNGTACSSGSSVRSFPNSASNSVLFKDSKKQSTANSHTASSPHVLSSSVGSERKDVPATKEVPVRKEASVATGTSVQKEVRTGEEVPERKEVPAVRKDAPVGIEVPERKEVPTVQKEVPAGLEVPEEQEIPVQKEVPLQEKILKGKEIRQHPDLQDRQDKGIPKSTGIPECRSVSDRDEVAEERKRISANGSLPPNSSSNSNRKTLLYSRVAGNSPFRIISWTLISPKHHNLSP